MAERARSTLNEDTEQAPNYCDFCGKRQDEALILIAAPVSFICDECVDACAVIVTEHRRAKGLLVEEDRDW